MPTIMPPYNFQGPINNPNMTGAIAGQTIPGGPPTSKWGFSDIYTIGGWKTKPTGDLLNAWNDYIKGLGLPKNTFGEVQINPKTGMYALRNVLQPINAAQSWAQAMNKPVNLSYGLSPWQKLNPGWVTSPVAAATTSPIPSQNPVARVATPVTSPRLTTTPNYNFNPFPTYYGTGGRGGRTLIP